MMLTLFAINNFCIAYIYFITAHKIPRSGVIDVCCINGHKKNIIRLSLIRKRAYRDRPTRSRYNFYLENVICLKNICKY